MLKDCLPKLKQLWNNISCKSKCSNCMVVKQDNHIEIQVKSIEQLKDIDFDIPIMKNNNIRISFI